MWRANNGIEMELSRGNGIVGLEEVRRLAKHGMKQRPGQFSGKGILLARVEGSDECDMPGEMPDAEVSKLWLG